MPVLITARDHSVSNSGKAYAREKAEKLFRYFNGIAKLEVILGSEGQGQRAEVILSLVKGDPIALHVDHDSMRAAIDLVMDQAQRSLTRHKEKIRDHHRDERVDPPVFEAEEEELESYQEVVDKLEFGT